LNCNIAIRFEMAVRQTRLVCKKRQILAEGIATVHNDFNWLPWQRLLGNQKKLNGLNKPLHPTTNPEISAKIGPLASEKLVLECGVLYCDYASVCVAGNLAVKKPSAQLSTELAASLANDGDSSTYSCTDGNEAFAWWSVDLVQHYYVNTVSVT